jgi:hypothetical protein
MNFPIPFPGVALAHRGFHPGSEFLIHLDLSDWDLTTRDFVALYAHTQCFGRIAALTLRDSPELSLVSAYRLRRTPGFGSDDAGAAQSQKRTAAEPALVNKSFISLVTTGARAKEKDPTGLIQVSFKRTRECFSLAGAPLASTHLSPSPPAYP